MTLEEQRLECRSGGQPAVRGVGKYKERRRVQPVANERVGLDVEHHATGRYQLAAVRESHRVISQFQHDVFEVRLRECGDVVIR